LRQSRDGHEVGCGEVGRGEVGVGCHGGKETVMDGPRKVETVVV
jgi:hypothetical protein